MTLASFNKLDKAAAEKLLSTSCGSSKWLRLLMENFPFADENEPHNKC